MIDMKDEPKKRDIHHCIARAFINTVTFANMMDRSGIHQFNPMVGMQARLLTDAQLMVIYDMAMLATDKSAVLAEYDRMLAKLTAHGATQGAAAMKEARESLENLLKQTESH